MPTIMKRSLKESQWILDAFLRQEYDHPVLNIGNDVFPPFRIDSFTASEIQLDACVITIQVSCTKKDLVELVLKNIPWNEDDVESWAYDMDGQWEELHTGKILKVAIHINRVNDFRELAKAVRRVTWNGGEYLDPNWKWIGRRTANSLNKFADRVMEFRRLRKNNPHLLPVPSTIAYSSGAACSSSISKTIPDDQNIFKLLEME